MNLRIRKILVLVIPFLALACLQCGEKEGSLDPIIETEPPQYTIASLTVDKSRIEPGEQAEVSVVVTDREGLPVAGHEIEFTVADDFGTIEATKTTDGSGTATATYEAPATTGVAAVTASGDDLLPKTTYIQVGEGMLIVDPATILADGLSTSGVYLMLVDGEGLPVEGAEVTFSLSPDRGMVYPATTETDSTGLAQATYYSAASADDETVTIEADITYEGATYVEFANVYTRGVIMEVDANPAEIPADGVSASMIMVWLKEATSGVPISGAEVTFGTNLGSIGGSAITDQEGFANVYLLSGTIDGMAVVNAVYGGFEKPVYVSFGELNVMLSAPYAKMVADGRSAQMVEATLLTEDNTPVSGVEVDFTTTHGVITKTASTNSRGKAKALLTSAGYSATATVRASFSGTQQSIAVAFEDPVVSLKTSPMTVIASPSNSSLITAYVSFTDGSPVPDSTRVGFATSEGTITNVGLTRSGMATAELRPTGVANHDVEVTAECGNSKASAQAIFVAGDPAEVRVSALPDAIAGGGGSSSTIVAEISDVYGNPVPDGTLVTFSVTGGNGVVTPTVATESGVATARFVPTGGGLATVRACCGTFCADAGVAILADGAGTIFAEPDTAWISVTGTGSGDVATIVAHVYDSHGLPVDNATDVSFNIEYGPGGGEYLDSPGNGYGPVVKQTTGGMASIDVNAGTKPGTVLLSIESGEYAAATTKVGICAGPPDSIFIGIGEFTTNGDGTYSAGVSAIVRDMYNNPVENGTVVYFTLDRSDVGFINPESYTGADYPCLELSGTPIKGVSRACLTYASTSTFETVGISASTSGGIIESREIWSKMYYTLPIIDGEIALQAVPATLDGTAGDSCDIFVTVSDHYIRGIDNATIIFTLEGDGQLTSYMGITDNTGMPITTLVVPPLTEAGKTKVKAKVWMIDVEGEIDITINE